MTLQIIPYLEFSLAEIEPLRVALLRSQGARRAVSRDHCRFESIAEIVERLRAAGTLHGTPETGGQDCETAEQQP
jgi:hypothetical protein